METPVLGFIPPVVGVDGEFNTIRLGGRKYKDLLIGSEVFLMDTRRDVIFGRAEVLDVTTGPLSALLAVYAGENHTEIGRDGDHAERLYQTIQKIYGIHIVQPNKLSTCIKLKRLE
jgi:hypothetical protein